MRAKNIIVAGLIGTTALITGVTSCTRVPAGNVAVIDTFGSVNEKELESGLHFINPFSRAVKMETRTLEAKETLNVPTKEGLMAHLDISVLYKIDPTKANEIYSKLGVDYKDVVLIPTLRNVGRDVVANYNSDDLYGANRSKISSDITKELTKVYSGRGILLENVLLRDVKLPEEVTNAINKKISAKQEAEQMEYTLQKETQEAERKKIEAGGIADAQKIIAKGLTQEYLQWKYITSLQELAKSPNNTFIITPYDQKLTPLISVQGKR